ncbi:IS607 family transposase [Sutterella sp.]|uniref:IS607 family transposase n=1 Tax=Sutterella sp. TaxID=1981025 RepID=UPI0026DFE0D6|nr:IS607 family transposase [Sutterella sp.]MDO5532531.1 IS607 family transposase [Sutterella sp.]
MTLCSISTIAKHYGVSPSTIRRWVERGYIKLAGRTFGGHRRFQHPADSDAVTSGERKVLGYARVSSHDQRSDLGRQIDRLKSLGCDEVLSDIGSGLNCRKPGLKALLRRLPGGRVSSLVVLHEDRLLRCGVELIRFLCSRMKTELKVIEAPPEISFEMELVRDVTTLMTVFAARMYGRRSHRNKRLTASNAVNRKVA